MYNKFTYNDNFCSSSRFRVETNVYTLVLKKPVYNYNFRDLFEFSIGTNFYRNSVYTGYFCSSRKSLVYIANLYVKKISFSVKLTIVIFLPIFYLFE